MAGNVEMTTKARTKGQRRRKRRSITMPGGETAPMPRGQGDREPKEDARIVALTARIRVHGIAKDNATSPLCTEGVDRCIMALTKPPEMDDVRQVWLRLVTAQHNYRTRILGMTGYPQGAAIAMLPDAMQADTGHTIDTRTADERNVAAKRAWAACQAAIAALPAPHFIWAIRNALTGGMDGQGGDVWREGQPTPHGVVLVAALRAMVHHG